MSLVSINWQPGKKELKSFGWAMLVGFALIGGVLHLGWFPFKTAHPTAALVCWSFGTISGVLGLAGTRAVLPIYWAWMGIAFVMGNIISRILLALVYYLVVTPIGLLMRCTGRDLLHLKRQAEDTYWVDVTYRTDKNAYERQF